MSNKIYRYYQPNDKDTKDNHSDCVIRALTKVLDKEWLTTFDDLLPYARDMQCMPSERKCYEEYLFDNGFAYQGISNRKGSKRPTVESFAKDHKQGNYLVNVANHVVAISDGCYYDTWDSGDCCLYGYYYKEEGENNEKENLATVLGTTICLGSMTGCTAGFKRGVVDMKSNWNGGMNRVITVYTADGKKIAEYKGKIDIDTNDGGYVKFDYKGKRYIYYNCFVESIADID